MRTGWTCPQCGDLNARSITWYREGLFNARSKRFDPRCADCGATAHFDPATCTSERPPAPVLVISGSCASGKTTLSYLLAERYGFVQIDGDWVLENRKAEEGRHVDFNEIHPYLLTMAEGLVRLGKPVAIAHVVVPEVVRRYETWLGERGIPHKVVVLMPDQSILLERNATRDCWPKTTPEYWVLRFYQDYLCAPDAVKACFYDNSFETPEETAAALYHLATSNGSPDPPKG